MFRRRRTSQPSKIKDLPMLSAAPWQMNIGERAAVEGILAQLRPTLSIEIGTAEGGSLLRIAEHSQEVHSFDLVEPQFSLEHLPHVHLHTGDSHALLPQFLSELAAAGRNVDFVMVDGDHTAAGVKLDMEHLLTSDAVRETVIVMHDTTNEEVRAGLDAVDYTSFSKVRIYDPDALPGAMTTVSPLSGQLWNGLGLVVVSEEPLALGPPGKEIVNHVSPTKIGLGIRELAGPNVQRDTDFAAMVRDLRGSAEGR